MQQSPIWESLGRPNDCAASFAELNIAITLPSLSNWATFCSLCPLSNDLTNSDVSYNELVDKYNKLLEQYDSLKASKNKLVESNKSYMINYLNEIANKNGINPKAVKLTSDMTVADIKQCVNEAVDRRDRYNKLPFSYEEPTKINVLNEHITKHSSEESLTEQFLQSVQNSI